MADKEAKHQQNMKQMQDEMDKQKDSWDRTRQDMQS